jgi:threonine/homoserine/homoserine lactone efflux protein
MSPLTFLSEAVLISLSGVMAPGPITAVTVGKGNESPHAGALVAIGHGIIEFPLMISIFYGFGCLLNLFYVKALIAFVGGLLLLVMGVSMFHSIKQVEVSSSKYTHSPMIAGMLLSLGNPYFLIWWATVGATLILRSVSFGMFGFLIFALLHWLCDFLWCYFLSALSFKGGRFFGRRFQRIVFAMCGVLLLFFSGKFITDAVRVFFI